MAGRDECNLWDTWAQIIHRSRPPCRDKPFFSLSAGVRAQVNSLLGFVRSETSLTRGDLERVVWEWTHTKDNTHTRTPASRRRVERAERHWTDSLCMSAQHQCQLSTAGSAGILAYPHSQSQGLRDLTQKLGFHKPHRPRLSKQLGTH